VGFVHRRLPDGEVYFVANTGPKTREFDAVARGRLALAEEWDPVSGRRLPARPAGRLALAPYASRFLVFRDSPAPKSSPETFHETVKALDLSHGWRLEFQDGHAFELDHLRDWRALPGMQHYSGLANYEKEIDLPSAALAGCPLELDFGEARPIWPRFRLAQGFQAWVDAPIREAAIVYVNDERAGTVWSPPYSLEVTGLLHAGRNKIRIEVGNLAINLVAGQPRPDYGPLKARYGDRFTDDDTFFIAAEPSGMLGPVRLRTAPGTCNSRAHVKALGLGRSLR
jgi:hypothetical protein